MNDERIPPDDYRMKARLLARKGAAEPLLRNEARLELVSDSQPDRPDHAQLADAVVEATAARLLRKQVARPAAPLTDLLDESLIGVVSPHSGQVGRNAPLAEDDER